MNAKIIYAALAGGIAYFLLGWVVWGMLLMGFFEANTIVYEGLIREEPMLILYLLSCLVTGYFLAYVFNNWAGFKTAASGFRGGLFMGLFISLGYDLMFYGGMNLHNASALVVDVIAATIVTGITGAIIGGVLGFGKKTDVAA